MWILILTIYIQWNGPAVTITTAEFNNKEACMVAGKLWKEKVKFDNNYDKRIAVCVPKGRN